jgi:CRISPR type IV-associated protein Csf3
VAITRRAQEALAAYEVGSDHVPLRLTFRLGTPLVMGHPWIHLDGLLAHFLLRDALGQDYWLLPAKLPLPLDIRLPLQQTGGVWHASVSCFDSNEWTTTTVYKRFEQRHAGILRRKRTKSINIQSGRFRNWMIRLPCLLAREVVFHACGDPDHVGRLLRHAASLGKKAAYGFGSVLSLEVAEVPADCSLHDQDGNASRPIPVRLLEEWEDQVPLAWRPPYWDRRNVAPCAPPGASIRLRAPAA